MFAISTHCTSHSNRQTDGQTELLRCRQFAKLFLTVDYTVLLCLVLDSGVARNVIVLKQCADFLIPSLAYRQVLRINQREVMYQNITNYFPNKGCVRTLRTLNVYAIDY